MEMETGAAVVPCGSGTEVEEREMEKSAAGGGGV
jgi:hypothetical protein